MAEAQAASLAELAQLMHVGIGPNGELYKIEGDEKSERGLELLTRHIGALFLHIESLQSSLDSAQYLLEFFHSGVVGAPEVIQEPLSSPLGNMPEPTPADMQSRMFNAIWDTIKDWDIGVPDQYSGHTGATGNHAKAILNAVRAAQN